MTNPLEANDGHQDALIRDGLSPTELVDTQTALEQWYGVPQVYVQTLEMQSTTEGRRQGIGRSIVSRNQALRSGEPAMIDQLVMGDETRPYIGVVRITPAHAAGHFRDGEGEESNPKILPAHKQLRAAVETIRIMEQQQGTVQGPVRLAGFDRAIFQQMVIADGNSELRVLPKRMEGGRYNVEIQLVRGGAQEICAQIEGLRVQPAVYTDDPVLLEDQLLEGAAQTVGAVEGQDTDEQHLPLLMEIGPAKFSGNPVRAGDGVAYHTITERTGAQQIVGVVKIHSEGKPIGETVVQARIVPKALLQRHLKSK